MKLKWIAESMLIGILTIILINVISMYRTSYIGQPLPSFAYWLLAIPTMLMLILALMYLSKED